jgi:general secretion pathway protein E
VNDKQGLTFAAALKSFLRQDPDIIMIGEIRDLETAQMAVQASLTGHLVLSTLHTNDSPSAVTRLLDLGVPHYLIQSTLTGVVAQRLVRTLCAHCKKPGTQDPDAWRVLTHGWDIPVPEQVYEQVGCLECRKTGFLGRTGVYEMMPMSSKLRSLISAELDLGRFGDMALREGMKPLRISAAMQVAAGLTTVREVLNVLPPTDIDDTAQP